MKMVLVSPLRGSLLSLRVSWDCREGHARAAVVTRDNRMLREIPREIRRGAAGLWTCGNGRHYSWPVPAGLDLMLEDER